jgi:hypothetical protein
VSAIVGLVRKSVRAEYEAIARSTRRFMPPDAATGVLSVVAGATLAVLVIGGLEMACQGSAFSPTDLLAPGQWAFSYGSMSGQPASDEGGGFHFDVPTYPRSVNYILRRQGAAGLGENVTATYAVDASPGAAFVGCDGPADPAMVYLIIEDSLGNRWWAPGSGRRLDRIGAGASVSVPLRSDHWTDYQGKYDEQRFNAAVHDLHVVGLTFGGAYAFGHGASVTKGNATFRLVSLEVQ